MRRPPDNAEIADLLERVADLLEAQEANAWRVRAYRAAARTARATERSLAELLAAEGHAGLVELPAIGKSIASAIEEYVHAGRLQLLERLEGQVSPEDLFTTVPGIGEDLAHRIHRDLGIETLEDLEVAAHDGRLETVDGFGRRRVRAVQDAVAGILSRSARRRARRFAAATQEEAVTPPPVALLLEVEGTYRERAAAGALRRIAPRRFNPEGKAWLPVLHVERAGWNVTAMFSNTARAHELGTTSDWVVLYAERDGHELQYTVVTERRGPQEGRRVVRGRERECAALEERGDGAP